MVAAPMPVRDFSKIPSKLKGYNQWIVWKLEYKDGRQTKIPYSAHSGYQASVTNPNHWSTFNQAQDVLDGGLYSGLGFVLSENDPFVFIDLDDAGEDTQLQAMHAKIIEHFKSYAERSPSGKGTHIICEGTIEDGKRSAANAAEMYASARYMTMTGDAINSYEITEQQTLVEILYAQLDHARSKPKLVVDNSVGRFESQDQQRSDEDVIASALNAQNGELFRALYLGGWEDIRRYQHSNGQPNQSAADQALFNFAGFHSKNAEQIVRIFHSSILGKRKKAFRRDYVQHMLDNSADWKVPTMEINIPSFDKVLQSQKETAGSNEAQPAVQEPSGKGNQPEALVPTYNFSPPNTSAEWVLNPPPGLIRDAAAFIHDAAYLQVREIALAGAVGLLAGICGRAFNVGGSGLNLYVTMLAPTGSGKEAMSSGMGAIEDSIAMSNPTAAGRILGPSDFASEQGLMRYLGDNPCFVSILGEFDNFVNKVCGPRASENGAGLKKALLDSYNKNSKGNSYRGSKYSDKQKNIESVKSPAVSIIGECTISGMKAIIDEKMIASGFIPRLITFVYDGKRAYPNRNRISIENEQTGLIRKLVVLFNTCAQISSQDRPVIIDFEPDALSFAHSIEIWITDHMNGFVEDSAIHQLYNRANQNILRLAALASIEVINGNVNMLGKIKIEHLKWASSVVWSSIDFWMKSFNNHEIGEQTNDVAQLRDVKKVISKFYKLTDAQKKSYNINSKMWDAEIISYAYIQSKTSRIKSLTEDKNGYARAIDKTLKMLEDIGILYDVRKDPECKIKYGSAQRAYKIVNKEALTTIYENL